MIKSMPYTCIIKLSLMLCAIPVTEKVLSSYYLYTGQGEVSVVELHECRVFTKANTGGISYSVKLTVIYTSLLCNLDVLRYCQGSKDI